MTVPDPPRTDYSTEYRLDLEKGAKPVPEIAAEASEHLRALRGLVETLRDRDKAIASLETFLNEIGFRAEDGTDQHGWDAEKNRLRA